MLPTIVLVAAIAVVWRAGVWPFSRSFKYLPSYDQFHANKKQSASAQTPIRPAE
jgi:hypothetical protein